MQIPHEVTPRPDTGLYNAKLGIWLFLASEVMLFGGLFSGYIFLRLGAEPGYWPKGLLNVPVGTFNTFVLILSSVTVIQAWVSLKMRLFSRYKFYMGITILCGILFLIVKLCYEYPQKFDHFGVFIKKDSMGKYEQYLGNEFLKSKGLDPRVEISGHLLDAPKGSPYEEEAKKNAEHFQHLLHEQASASGEHAVPAADAHAAPAAEGHTAPLAEGPVVTTEDPNDYVIQLDPGNAYPTDPSNEKPSFLPKKQSMLTAVVHRNDIEAKNPSMFVPRHSPYFAVYFTITGLHGLHVLGGVLVFIYFWGPGAALYRKNPEHLANRVEVVGLFWHFVDLVWIFAFPLFYLL